MASRCTKVRSLEVHHISRRGGNSLSNARVLCHNCHVNTRSYGIKGITSPDFSEETKKAALKRAGNQCECRKDNCH